MSLYNLEKIFAPASVAVIGASERKGSIGRALMDNLLAGGFPGPILPINPKREEVLGRQAFPSLEALDRPVDLAVLAAPIATAPEVIGQCARLGIGGAVIISGGGKEAGAEGRALEAEISLQARQGSVRLIGPNCLGVVSSPARLNASFAHIMPLPGKLAFVSQSGAICTAVLDFALTENIGFSYFISVGSMLDVDFGDLIDYLGNDPEVSSILLYVESVTNHRKFMSAARAVSRVKPIIVLKVGRSQAGARAAWSHTGAMAGEDSVYEAAFKRAGVIRVETIEDLFGCAELVGKQPLPKGRRLAIISNAGGPGVMAADYLASRGVEPARLSRQTMAQLDELLPPFWSRSNPIDILGHAPIEVFRRVLEICMSSRDFDAALVMSAPQALIGAADLANGLIPTLKGQPFPVFTVWMGGREMIPAREAFSQASIPTFDSPERAIRAFLYMYCYEQNQRMLREVPPKLSRTLEFDQTRAREVVATALERGEPALGEVEAKELLAAYGIPVSPTRAAADEEEAVRLAREMGFPVVMKLVSPEITHKSDAGGVKLNLGGEAEVRRAFAEIMDSARAYNPRARLLGVTIQPMIRAKGHELLLGLKKDPDFGPVILFGLGGILAEVFKDRSLGLPPLNPLLAQRLMEETRVHRLLGGYRNLPAVNTSRLEEILVRLSQLAIDLPEVVELDINPLLASGQEALALDARVLVEPAAKASPRHLVIAPYPDQYEYQVTTKSGLELFVRPIKPEDAPLMVEFWHALSPQTVYYRFLKPLRSLSQELLARHTQIDYDREMALVALQTFNGRERIVGVCRLVGHPDGHEAELGISIGDEWQGQGVAAKLLEIGLPIARERGVKRVWGQFFPESRQALALARRDRCEITPVGDGRILRFSLDLDALPQAGENPDEAAAQAEG